jgi:ankyrin repeat protein
MALFAGSLKKMQNELESSTIDWNRLAGHSSGKYDFSGKNAPDARSLVSSLIKRAAEYEGDPSLLAAVIRNVSSRGADFHRPMNETGGSPVHLAASIPNGILLRALLDAGVQPVATTHSGATPLHRAIASGCEENARMLIAAGADPGAEDNNGDSPLHHAVRIENCEAFTLMLLKAGAKAYLRNTAGKTPVDLAMEAGKAECADLLKESLYKLRMGRKGKWHCPGCGSQIRRPQQERINWYLSIQMWEHLNATCGECGRATPATVLDGEG